MTGDVYVNNRCVDLVMCESLVIRVFETHMCLVTWPIVHDYDNNPFWKKL